jgi:hypothetical protein
LPRLRQWEFCSCCLPVRPGSGSGKHHRFPSPSSSRADAARRGPRIGVGSRRRPRGPLSWHLPPRVATPPGAARRLRPTRRRSHGLRTRFRRRRRPRPRKVPSQHCPRSGLVTTMLRTTTVTRPPGTTERVREVSPSTKGLLTPARNTRVCELSPSSHVVLTIRAHAFVHAAAGSHRRGRSRRNLSPSTRSCRLAARAATDASPRSRQS